MNKKDQIKTEIISSIEQVILNHNVKNISKATLLEVVEDYCEKHLPPDSPGKRIIDVKTGKSTFEANEQSK